ncbi:hypothetical protein NQD34_003353 [Periophthalmus magnuspinnatus]|nr:hypothetical protein NQD34_003353 [Periophthalmus magnuspinnatus]
MFLSELLQAAHGSLLELHQTLTGTGVLHLNLPLALRCTGQGQRNSQTKYSTREMVGRNLSQLVLHSFAHTHRIHGDAWRCQQQTSLAFLAYSVMSSWERPSVNTRPIRGMLRLAGRAPSASEKLFSSMCFRARPVIVPFSM